MKETPILPQVILQPWNGLTVMITGLLNQPRYFWGLPEFAFTSRLTASSPVNILQYFKKYNFVFIYIKRGLHADLSTTEVDISHAE